MVFVSAVAVVLVFEAGEEAEAVEVERGVGRTAAGWNSEDCGGCADDENYERSSSAVVAARGPSDP